MLRICCLTSYKKLFLCFVWIVFSLSFHRGLQGDVTSHQKEEKIHLCLTMTVSDDEAVIEECLKSVTGIVDCVSICDMGSTDGTLGIIQEFLEEMKIPGMIHSFQGVQANHNSMLSIKKAQETLEQFGFSLAHTYLVTLNPDMKLHVDGSFQKDHLREDGYLLLEKSYSLAYSHYNPRLLKASFAWENVSILDGVWTYQGRWPTEKLHSLTITEESSGKRKTAQLKAEVASLQRALQKDPNNDEYLFRLAQAYKGLNRYPDAIRYYEARLEKNVYPEEIWFSKLMLGECYEASDMWENAIHWYLEAYQQDPSRPESLFKLATHYRFSGKNELAYLFAKHGSLIPLKENPNLSEISPFLPYQFDEEISISAFYTRFREEGFNATNNLLLKKGVSWWTKHNAYLNMQYYVQPLQDATYLPIILDLPLIQEGYDERYHPMNPSICKTPDGYKVICRTVNYTQKDAKFFHTIDESGIFKTRNYLLEYDEGFNLISQKEIIENLPRERYRYFSLEGLDDCRIFEQDGQYWFTCTTSDTNPLHNFQISLCKLEDQPQGATIQVEELIPLNGPDPLRCEKNWLPFVYDHEFYVIYSQDPFIIYKPDTETGDCDEIFRYSPSLDLSHFRGSAGPIHFDGGYLMTVHEVISLPGYERRYIHRFVYLDEYFVVQKMSAPFTFLHLGIEYCCGMTSDHRGERIVLSFGVEDHDAYLCFVDQSVVKSLLKPIDNIK